MSPEPAVLVVAEGIVTLAPPPADGARPRALLLRGDRIAWVGSDSKEAPAADALVDAAGAWITPSFVDAHVHGTATGFALIGVDLTGTGTVVEALERLAERAAVDDAPVLLGSGWDESTWREGRAPTGQEISAAAPGRTVLLARVDGHSAVVDPGTLARLPLDRLDGVDRDEHGRPTGWLRERASEAARTDVLARVPDRQFAAAREAASARALELGIGSMHEMGHPGVSGLDDALAWEHGDHPVEVVAWWAELHPTTAEAAALRPGGDLFLDGSIGSHTAAVSRPYRDRPDASRGDLFHTDEEVADFFTRATLAGRAAAVHAIGDRAIEQAISAIEAAADRAGREAVVACRHRVEHVELPTRGQVRRFAALGVAASVQPAFDRVWGGSDRLYARRFGAEAALRSNPLRWFVDEGVALVFSSDSPVTPLDPWGTVAAAEAHRGGLGVDRRTALAASTLAGRLVAGQDDVGPLVAGARADLALWDCDPLHVDDVTRLRCMGIAVAGRCSGAAFGDTPDRRSG